MSKKVILGSHAREQLKEGIDILADAVVCFDQHCAQGIEPNRKVIDQLLNDSLMLVTALNNKIGYYKAAEIANKAHKEGTTLKEAAVSTGYLTEKEFDAWVRPEDMIGR